MKMKQFENLVEEILDRNLNFADIKISNTRFQISTFPHSQINLILLISSSLLQSHHQLFQRG